MLPPVPDVIPRLIETAPIWPPDLTPWTCYKQRSLFTLDQIS